MLGDFGDKHRRFVALCGMTMLLSAFMVMFSVFLIAYLSPTKSAIIYIDLFKEANIEFAILLFTSIFGLYSFSVLAKDLRD